MSKKSSDNLHQLIKSLSGNEKRYFKMFMKKSIKHDNKIFDILFDAIEKQEEYSEKEILKKFHDKPFAKQFALTKTRLYDQVMRSLDALYSDSSIDAELKQNLHFVEILFRKTLYRQAEKLLYFTKKKALKFEKISSLIEISMWQKRLLEKSGYAGNADEQINEIESHDAWLSFQLNTHNDFWSLKSHLFSSLNKSGKSEKMKEFGELLNKKFEKVNYETLTVENKYILHHTQSAFYFGINDYENCYSHLISNAKLIEQNVILFNDEPNIYFSVLSNLIFVCNRLGKNSEALEALKKLRDVEQLFDFSNNEDLQLKHFNTLSSAEITLYKLTGNFEEALKSLLHIEESLERFSDKLNPTRKGFYYFNLCAVYLANGKFSRALKWCNELLNDKSIDENENIRTYALVLSILIHFDLGHNDYFSTLTRQLEKQFSGKQTSMPQFFEAFVDFGNKLSDSRNERSHRELLEFLGRELASAKKNGEENEAFEHFDFQRWVQSRASGIPFSMVSNPIE